jgi:molybdopterin converting factor small subunit
LEVKATVKYSFHRKYLGDQEFPDVNLPDGATAKDLVEKLAVPKYYLREIRINGEVKDLNTTLSEGDDVVIWPPLVGGG